MEKYSVYVPKLLPKQENFIVGRRSCRGCGKALAVRFASKAIDECSGISRGEPTFGKTVSSGGYGLDEIAFPALVASVVKGVKNQKGGAVKKPAIAVDMKAFESSLVSLESFLEKAKDILVLLYDNESSMDSIIRNSRHIPFGVDYHYHPPGKKEISFAVESRSLFNIVEKLGIKYASSSSIAYPFDLIGKIKEGNNAKGTAVVHVHSPCPTGWMFPPSDTVKIGVLAVESGFHPLWEYKNGEYTLSIAERKLASVNDYIRAQKRYRYMPDEFIKHVESAIDKEFSKLEKLCG